MKKRSLFVFYITMILFFTSCVSLKDASVYKNENLPSGSSFSGCNDCVSCDKARLRSLDE